MDRVHAAGDEIVQVSVAAGGVLSGEHGIGLEKRDLMPLLFSSVDLDLQARLARGLRPRRAGQPRQGPSRRQSLRRPATGPGGRVDLTAFAEEVGVRDQVTCVGLRQQWDVGGSRRRGPGGAGAGGDRLDRARGDDGGLRRRHTGRRAGRRPGRDAASGSPCRRGARSVACLPSVAAASDGWATARYATPSSKPAWSPPRAGGQGGRTRRSRTSAASTCAACSSARSAPWPSWATSSCAPGPRPLSSGWFRAETGRDASELFRSLYRPVSVLWDGTTTWALLEGHPSDVAEQASTHRLMAVEAPPALPVHRWSMPPSALAGLDGHLRGGDRRRHGASGRAGGSGRASRGRGGAAPPPQGAVRSRGPPEPGPGSAPGLSVRRGAEAGFGPSRVAVGTVAPRWICSCWTTSWPPASAADCACLIARRTE